MDTVRAQEADDDRGDRTDDEWRDEILRRMLTTKPKRNEELKLGKPRNPHQQPKAKKPASK